MRDSLMLSSLTVGEKQHPRLGGCVRVFFQLFDWNRRLANNKKRIFSQKQLPSERHIRRALIKAHTDESGEAPLCNVDADQVIFIKSGEGEDNLQVKKLGGCSREEIIGGEGMRKVSNDGVVHEPEASPGFSTAKESLQESALLIKSPGIIGKLMGLDSLPSFPSTPPCEIIQKGSPTHTHVDSPESPPPFPSATVIPFHQDHDSPKLATLAFQHGLPEEELTALLSELNGNMCTILSALPPHIGISSRSRLATPSTPAPPHTPSTTPRLNSPMGVSSSCSCATSVTETQTNAIRAPGASSLSNATLTQRHSPARDVPIRITENATNASMSSITLSLSAYEERANKPKYMEGAHPRDGLSELKEQRIKCSRAGEGNVGSIKSEKRVEAKNPSNGGGKRLSQKSVSAGIYDASIDLNVPGSPQQLQDVGRTTGNKPVRRKKVDTPMEERLQEDVKGYRPLEDQRSSLRGSPMLDHALIPHRKQEDAGVRGSPCDQSSCSLASRNSACTIDDDCLLSSNFAIHYNVGFFEEYHKGRGKLPSARKSKHFNDNGTGKAQESNALADHDHHSSRNATVDSSAAGAKEETSFIRTLIKRRAAREAAATAAMEAAGVLRTASPADADHLPAAITSSSADSLQSMISSCSTNPDNDPNRREKLSAGRSEAGGSDFSQVLHPVTYGMQRSRAAAACCMSGSRNCEGGGMQRAAGIGDSNDDRDVGWCANLSMGNHADGVHRAMCMAASNSMACTTESAAGEGVQVEICGTSHAGSGKNTTAAMLQDVISALNGSALCTPVSAARRCRHHHNHRHLFSDDDGCTPSTADGNDTESTSESGSCWAAASQPSPVSVLAPPFDDDVSPAGDEGCWIQSEEEYVSALLAATSENGKTSLTPAKLFGKLEERVIPTWPDSEVPTTRGYRRLVFDCVCEAVGQAADSKEGRGNRRGKARVLFEEMCRWRQRGSEIVLDDLVEAELRKACNGWVAFEVQTHEIGVRLERTIFGLLVEELVCDLVLA